MVAKDVWPSGVRSMYQKVLSSAPACSNWIVSMHAKAPGPVWDVSLAASVVGLMLPQAAEV